MYDELVKRLRRCEQFRCRECEYEQVMGCRAKLNSEAADAIEVLTKETTDDAEFMCSIIDEIRNYAAKNNMEPDDTLKTVANNILSLLEISTFNHCEQKEGE